MERLKNTRKTQEIRVVRDRRENPGAVKSRQMQAIADTSQRKVSDNSTQALFDQ